LAPGEATTPETRDYISQAIKNLGPSAMITRDNRAYKHYAELSDFAHRGIDCAFFINQYRSPPMINEEYIVLTFDHNKEPNIAEKSYSDQS
jgi:hypothetical protein